MRFNPALEAATVDAIVAANPIGVVAGVLLFFVFPAPLFRSILPEFELRERRKADDTVFLRFLFFLLFILVL